MDIKKIGIDAVLGGAAGAADQFAQFQDEKRSVEAVAAGKTLSQWAQFGTYLNFIAPAATVVAVGMNWLRGENATRATVIAGQLAGRKAVHRWVKVAGAPVSPAPYAAWRRAQAMANAAASAGPSTRTYEGEFQAAGTKF